MRAGLTVFVSAAVLSACATIPGTGSETAAAPKTDRLSPRSLPPGECGMFVWTANEAKKFLLFAQYVKGRAIWFNGDAEEYLKTLSVYGDPSNGQYPGQIFETQNAKTLTLDLKQPEIITNGTRFKGGTLTVSSGEDWDQVRPVVGLAACQTG